MSKLPRGLSARKVLRALKRAGFYKKHQKGSHIVMRRDNPFAQVVVPYHRSVDTGTLAPVLATDFQKRCDVTGTNAVLGGFFTRSQLFETALANILDGASLSVDEFIDLL